MFSDLKAVLGAALGLVVGLGIAVLIYEGVHLPWFGQVIPGIVSARVDAAKKGLVSLFELETVKAQLKTEQDLRKAAEDANTENSKRVEALAATAKQRQDALTEAAKTATKFQRPLKEELEWLNKP